MAASSAPVSQPLQRCPPRGQNCMRPRLLGERSTKAYAVRQKGNTEDEPPNL